MNFHGINQFWWEADHAQTISRALCFPVIGLFLILTNSAAGGENGPVPTPTPFNVVAGNVTWSNFADEGSGLLGVDDASRPVTGGFASGDFFDDAMAVRVGGQPYGDPNSSLDVLGLL